MQQESFTLLGLFASAFISSTVAPGGSEAVLAYMVSTKIYPADSLIAIATIGNTLGALTTWGLGYWTAKKYPVDRVFSEKRQQSIDTVSKWGGWALLLSWLPVIGDGLCFAGGWLKLSLTTSVIAIFVGKAVRYIAVAYASAMFG